MSLELDEKWEYPSNSTINSLENLMEINEAKEDLRGVNKAFCQNCGTDKDAEKNITWTVGPSILVMQLKRYKKKGRRNYWNRFTTNSYYKTETACILQKGTQNTKHS